MPWVNFRFCNRKLLFGACDYVALLIRYMPCFFVVLFSLFSLWLVLFIYVLIVWVLLAMCLNLSPESPISHLRETFIVCRDFTTSPFNANWGQVRGILRWEYKNKTGQSTSGRRNENSVKLCLPWKIVFLTLNQSIQETWSANMLHYQVSVSV